MIAILGGIAGGLGLFFMGAKLLSEHLRLLTNRRLRMSAARWTKSRWTGFAWGALAGAVAQAMPALIFIAVSMLRSGLLSVRRAFPILLGGNVGGACLLLIVTLDAELIVLYVLGVSQFVGLIATRNRANRYQTMAVVLFGMGMMVLGFVLLTDSVAPLAAYPWFKEAVVWAGGSLLLCLLGGLLLCTVVQSSGVVTVSGISLAAAGLLSVEQALMINCGACLGSSLSLYLLTLNLTGRSRQVAMYQVLYNCVLNAIFVPLIYLEAYSGVPLLKAAALSSGLPLAQVLAIFAILFEVITSLFQLLFLGLAARLVERWWPTTEEEMLLKPKFIHDDALEDANTSLMLVDLEQRRMLEILSRCLDTVRQGTDLATLREVSKEMMNRIEEFLDDLAANYPDQGVDDHISMLTRQQLLFWLNERLLELCDVLQTIPPESDLDAWRTGLVEGIDAVLLALHGMLSTDEEEHWASTTQLMSDRSELMRRTRNLYLGDDSSLDTAERASVLRLTSITEHVFLLLSRLAHEYQQLATSETPESKKSADGKALLAAGAENDGQ